MSSRTTGTHLKNQPLSRGSRDGNEFALWSHPIEATLFNIMGKPVCSKEDRLFPDSLVSQPHCCPKIILQDFRNFHPQHTKPEKDPAGFQKLVNHIDTGQQPSRKIIAWFHMFFFLVVVGVIFLFWIFHEIPQTASSRARFIRGGKTTMPAHPVSWSESGRNQTRGCNKF